MPVRVGYFEYLGWLLGLPFLVFGYLQCFYKDFFKENVFFC